jgi:hypothetical protein
VHRYVLDQLAVRIWVGIEDRNFNSYVSPESYIMRILSASEGKKDNARQPFCYPFSGTLLLWCARSSCTRGSFCSLWKHFRIEFFNCQHQYPPKCDLNK